MKKVLTLATVCLFVLARDDKGYQVPYRQRL